MRYRNMINQRLDVLESSLTTLEQIVQRQLPIQEYLKALEQAKENLLKVKEMVSLEPITNNEISN